MQGMSQYGRNGDTMMAHVAPGEMVVPQEVLQSNPQVTRGLGMAFEDVGADPLRYTVGSGQNSMNPTTGQPEFFFDKLIPFLTKAASNPIVQGAIGNAALRKIQGKDVRLRDVLLGGVGGATIGGFTGRGTGMSGLDSLLGLDLDSGDALTQAVNNVTQGSGTGSIDAAKNFAGNITSSGATGSNQVARGENLMGLGEMFGTDPSKGGLFANALNTPIGESLAFGLGSKVLSMLFPPDDEETDEEAATRRFNESYAEKRSNPSRLILANTQRPSGTAQQIEEYLAQNPSPNSSLVQLNKGGPAYYPRRDGGIMPSEGSGTEDDVPAMLTAGEFVMTRGAVEGAGNGDLNQGIQEMYSMMDDLERKA